MSIQDISKGLIKKRQSVVCYEYPASEEYKINKKNCHDTKKGKFTVDNNSWLIYEYYNKFTCNAIKT
jgi:hypothetical protein